jgi:hypothetical protein
VLQLLVEVTEQTYSALIGSHGDGKMKRFLLRVLAKSCLLYRLKCIICVENKQHESLQSWLANGILLLKLALDPDWGTGGIYDGSHGFLPLGSIGCVGLVGNHVIRSSCQGAELGTFDGTFVPLLNIGSHAASSFFEAVSSKQRQEVT